MKKISQVTIGILLAVIILFIARVAYVQYIAHEIKRQIQEREIRTMIEKDIKLKEKILDDQKRQLEREIAELESELKDMAWKAYYQPPEKCLTSKSVDCVNAEINAKREFEKIYSNY